MTGYTVDVISFGENQISLRKKNIETIKHFREFYPKMNIKSFKRMDCIFIGIQLFGRKFTLELLDKNIVHSFYFAFLLALMAYDDEFICKYAKNDQEYQYFMRCLIQENFLEIDGLFDNDKDRDYERQKEQKEYWNKKYKILLASFTDETKDLYFAMKAMHELK